MAKRSRKTSVRRKISARPLSFWNFIRKNFLIIAGLLLLPVTVGAVVSSYNYANQSSAASLKSQTLNLGKAGSSSTKPPAEKTLRTQGISGCLLYYGSGTPYYVAEGTHKCVDVSGQALACYKCTNGDGYAWTDDCTDNEKRACGIDIALPTRSSLPTPFLTPDPTTNVVRRACKSNQCRLADGQCGGAGYKGYVGGVCTKCEPDGSGYGNWVSCEEDRPAPTSAPSAADTGSGGDICSWTCGGARTTDNPSGCPTGFDVNIPDIGCNANDGNPNDGQGTMCGKKCSVGAAGFNLQKAIKNFFGIFGF